MSKRTRILDAAEIEFGTKGYEAASTNIIHKEAEVSKGTIFRYFNSKAELYYQLFIERLDKVVAAINNIEFKSEDIYEKIIEITAWKIAYFTQHPYLSQIFIEAFSNPPKEIANKISKEYKRVMKLSLDNFFSQIDMNDFSNEYTKDEVIRFLNYALNGLQKIYIQQKLTVESLQTFKDEGMKFIKTVLRGMKK